ncbi:MAG: T9SS type A sorting domain-containing protein, partial [Candidatus Fermentibacteraceae bacterium]|nr:T9SS type A sorting domain-containing protein [Candidatus Fermentibacteraceae bacterium]
HVGDSSIPMDAVDLAGNTLDYDPSTVAAPRNPVTGLFDYTYVESEPYDTGSWGVPSYRKVSSGVFLGGVFGKTFYVTPGITGSLIGDCPYWCGFWLERQRPEITSPIIVDIVEPDGSYTTTTIFSGDSCSLDEYALTPAPIAGRYGWFLWCTVWYDPIIIVIPPDTIPRYKYHFRATVIDSWNPGSILHTEDLGVGQSWPVAQTVHTPMIEAYGVHYESDENERGPWHPSGIRIVDGPLGDGSVYIERNYSIYPDGWLIDTVLVELPSVVDHYETNPPEDVPLYGLRVNSLIPEYSISPTSPNPCHNSVTINFSLLEQGPTEVTVFDISGRTVRRLVDCVVMEGVHDVIWDLKDDSNERVPSGLYFVRIQSGDWTGTTRLIVAR